LVVAAPTLIQADHAILPAMAGHAVISFRKASLPRDRDALVAFDYAVFGTDAFYPGQWDEYEAHWMTVDGRRVGCCAFKRHTDFTDRPDQPDPARRGSLYIVSTGILPEYQRQGFGERFKRWQIAFARRNGFWRIVTNSRKSNHRMIALNRKVGFELTRITKGSYYSRPAEVAVAMELKLPRGARSRIDQIVALLISRRDRIDRALRILA
jgi:ribosomal protein S18 acetylase RimI-like enzyme